MNEFPPPDVRDASGRMRRLVLSFVLGVIAASIAYVLLVQLAHPDSEPVIGGQRGRAWKFVFYFTGAAGAGVFAIAIVIQNHLARKRWRAEQVAPARARKAS